LVSLDGVALSIVAQKWGGIPVLGRGYLTIPLLSEFFPVIIDLLFLALNVNLLHRTQLVLSRSVFVGPERV